MPHKQTDTSLMREKMRQILGTLEIDSEMSADDDGSYWISDESKNTALDQLQQLIDGEVKSLFPEYDTVTNPSYTFMISKKELDSALTSKGSLES